MGQAEVASQYAEITYKVIGAAMSVHNRLGPGLREIVYQQALSAAMRDAGLSFQEEVPFQITLDEEQVGLVYLDHLVEDSVVVEEKALGHLLTNDEVAQIVSYLVATEKQLGLLLNFGRKRLEYKRILPPRSIEEWRSSIGRYAWQPNAVRTEGQQGPNPLIRSQSAEDSKGEA